MKKIHDQNIYNSTLNIPSARIPGFVFVKDINSTFLDLSQDLAQLVGWKSPDDARYKTDYELPCPASEFADQFRANDKQVIDTKQKMLLLEIQNWSSGWVAILTQKHPLLDNDEKVIGMVGQSIQISNKILLKQYGHLNSLDNKIINTTNKAVNYILNSEHSPLDLTPKQQSCVFLLIRGKGFKEIAHILNISVRTVESHIEAIKHKLGCYTKGQIIEKAIDSGFLYYIPEDFL